MRKFIIAIMLPVFLIACGTVQGPAPSASQAEIQQAVYRHAGPPSLTLFTVISNSSGAGAHSGLMVNASQRVLFDPAGSWWSPSIAQRGDVHYGVTPQVLSYYIDYHTRETYRTVMQTITVSPEVAEAALRAVQANGAAPKAYCTKSISAILKSLPGFEAMQVTFYPKNAMAQFGKIAGVTEHTVHDYDADDNSGLLQSQQKNQY